MTTENDDLLSKIKMLEEDLNAALKENHKLLNLVHQHKKREDQIKKNVYNLLGKFKRELHYGLNYITNDNIEAAFK